MQSRELYWVLEVGKSSSDQYPGDLKFRMGRIKEKEKGREEEEENEEEERAMGMTDI